MKRPILKLTGLLLASMLLAGCLVIEWSEFGTPPDEARLKSFASSEQFNVDKSKFENRRPGLIDKDRDEAMNPEFILSWFQGGEDSTPVNKLPEAYLELTNFLATKDKFQFVWLGHSSLLMNIDGIIILVDPVFSKNVAPVSFSSKRFQPLVIDPKDIPQVDVVLISHDHYDHLDMETVQQYQDSDVTFVTTLGVGSHLQGWGIDADNIVEKDWSESFNYKGIEFTAAPSQHFSGRGLSDTNKTLWASWIISTDKHNVFFSGDSGYDDHFREIGEQYGPFDLAFMENGQYDDRFKAAHMLPEEVAVAYKELSAKKVFPIHWGMFALNLHAWYEPPERLLQAVENYEDVVTPLIGYVYDLEQLPNLDRWWEAGKGIR